MKLQNAFELGRVFKDSAIQNFGSEVSKISFADSNVAAQKINGWIARKTNDQIDNVVSPVLANAIYFKGLWKTIFKPELTKNKEFRLSNGQKKSLPFMSLRSSFKCVLDTSIKSLVAVLPFEGEQYSLVLLLPQPNSSIAAMLESLNGDKLAEYQNIRARDTLIEIPKFTVRGNIDLYPIFNMMGITKMFSSASELTNIGLYRSTSPQVSSAVHSAMMSIDERGATAAASSVVTAVALSYDLPSVIFRADRPFLAVLWDNQLNVPLFMTKIEDPSL
ncbi:hypothetical protein MSG28_011917 [Choristoneura fumiferana]|uniref:Uncharacterized protein n=1 Tax=Choristoneura fumiferana TaxID=7141 RepID=A0ACC0KN55_CHOFU|nr:hypothetical protein MSG28_011917 [Choristoneura fumiferana]